MNIKYFILIHLRNYFLNYILFIYLLCAHFISKTYFQSQVIFIFLNNLIIINRTVCFINIITNITNIIDYRCL